MRSKRIKNFAPGRKTVTGKLEADSANQFIIRQAKLHRSIRCLWPNYDNFSQRMGSFEHITTSGLKSDVIISPQCTRFPIKTRPFQARYTIFGDFCDDNVCACEVSTLILLPVVNIINRIWIRQHRFPT